MLLARLSRSASLLLVALLLLVLLILAPARPALAAGVRGDVAASVVGKYFGANALGAVSLDLNWALDLALTEGTGANQADKIFADRRTLAASATENLDLAGVLPDPFGATLTFVTVKAIVVKASAANTNDLVIGAAGSNPFTGPLGGTSPTISVRPGGMVVLAAPATGWTVTAGTGDILKVTNGGSGTGVTYDIIIIGTSA